MKQLFLDQANTYFLDAASATNVAGLTVTLTVVGESGDVLTDNSGNPLRFSTVLPTPSGMLPLTYDGTAKKYKVGFQFNSAINDEYVRAYWAASNSGVPVDLTGYYPEELSIVRSMPSVVAPQICSAQYFLDAFLAADEKLDDEYSDAITAFTADGKINLARELLASQGELERRTKLKFFITPLTMERDFYMQEFRNEFWQQQTDWRPVVSLDSFLLVYGGTPIDVSNNIASQMAVDKKMGIIEFLPTVVSGNLFTMLISSISALGATIVARGDYSRVPMLFRIEYKAGLDFPNLSPAQKESIRRAVCRNALINLFPRIDPMVRKGSESLSLDGASRSKSNQITQIIQTYKEEEKQWVSEIMREYGTNVDIAVV